MSNLPKSLVRQAKKYQSLDEATRKDLIQQLYCDYLLSWKEAADLCNTYPNKLRRDAKKYGIKSRSKSEAQALALSEGRHSHPTKDKGHDIETKIKISESIAKDWDNMTEEEREVKRKEAKERWEQKTPEEIRQFREAAGEGVRLAAKEGSALEKYLLRGLIDAGYKVEFHKERWVIRDRLQIDLFIPELDVAIEVDGPSHFEDIWGEENLKKNQQRDKEKTGLLLQKGCVIIRVRQTQSLSNKYKRDTLGRVLNTLRQIEHSKPVVGKRHIILGE